MPVAERELTTKSVSEWWGARDDVAPGAKQPSGCSNSPPAPSEPAPPEQHPEPRAKEAQGPGAALAGQWLPVASGFHQVSRPNKSTL